MPLVKLEGAANRQSHGIARKLLALCHRNTRLGCVLTNAIRERKKRENWIKRFSEVDDFFVTACVAGDKKGRGLGVREKGRKFVVPNYC